MDTTTSIKPKSMAELLPGLSGILSKDSMQTLTAKKQPRQTMVQTRTAEKVVKPLTIAEMRADILSLRVQSPRRPAQGATSARKKNWNSSVKVDKTISHTANGKMKLNPVRKVLNFQPKPKPVMSNTNSRVTMAPEAPKFPKPEYRPKKSMYLLQARNNVRISGINNISETPVVTKPPISRLTLANKENVSHQPSIKKFVPPKPLIRKQIIPTIPDTPMSNESWKSSCDASFLQKEKEINDAEAKTKAIMEEPTLDNIAAVTPPVSTPFKEYRSVQEYFNHSSELESSAVYHDNTIMSFDKPESKENTKREESVIVSLCDLLNKASVTTTGKMSTELEDLLQIEKQTEHNLKMIDNSIAALSKIKESQLTSLKYVRKLINDKKPQENGDKTLTDTKETTEALVTVKNEKSSPEHKPVVSKPCSVIKSCSKSPSYKIPKKNLCLRKKVFCKSMPNVSNETITPVKSDMGNRALSMYMKMKEHMNFLNTPVAKRDFNVPDTPAVTSHNLQKQLDKLYDEN